MSLISPAVRQRWARGAQRRIGLLPRARHLRVVQDDLELAFVHDAATAPLSRPGVLSHALPSSHMPHAELAQRLAGRAAGPAMPDWAQGVDGALRAGVSLMRAAHVQHAPEFGAIIDPEGRVYRTTIGEALYFTPTLAALPETHMISGRPLFAPSRRAPARRRASVFVPWGARFNYGHFLIDALAGLALLADRGLLDDHPALAPPLTGWQRALLDLMLRSGETVEEIADPLVRIDDVMWTSCMDHFLQSPSAPLDSVRARILAAVPDAPVAGPRVYLSRRGDHKRLLLNEAELEAALIQRGFTVVAPETLPIAEQVALFRHAEVVVAPTGAALANCMFMPPGSAVFEIQPSNFLGVWQRNLCELFDVRWHGFFCESPVEELEIRMEGVLHAGVQFTWEMPLDEFLQFVDTRLEPAQRTF